MVEQGCIPVRRGQGDDAGLARKFRMGYEIEDKLAQMKAPAPKDPGDECAKGARARA
jgi:hypothetical protein